MIESILYAVVLVCLMIVAYNAGSADHDNTLSHAKADLVTERSVRHNLNCLVGDLKATSRDQEAVIDVRDKAVFELRAEVKRNKADALAYHQSVGLWCTDQPELIRHHAKKERFFRLGYPEHKL